MKQKLSLDNCLELTQNTLTGIFYGGLGNLVVNNYKAKPPCVLPGAVMGGLLLYGITRGTQKLDASKVFNDISDITPTSENKF